MITPYNSFDVLVLCGRHGICEGMEPFGIWAGIILCIGFLAIVARQFPWELRAMWAWAAGSAATVALFPTAHFGDYQRAMQGSAGQSLAMLTIIPIALAMLGGSGRERMIQNFRWVIWLELILINTGTSALLIAPTFDLALCALYLPDRKSVV